MKISHLGLVPVKCAKFRDVWQVDLAEFGFVGDRDFILVDRNGRLLGPAHHGPFISLKFTFEPATAELAVDFAGGRRVSWPVVLADQCENLDYLGMRTIVVRKVLGGWDKLLSDHSGLDVRLFKCERQGAGIDVLPITLLTTGSLRKLSEVTGEAVDHRRFRANIVIDHDVPHAEDGWEGRIMRIGTARLRVRSSVPRCLVTQLDPETGENNLRVVPGLGSYRRRVGMPDGLLPQYRTPGFASYAEVVAPGRLAVGDPVLLEDA